MIKKKTKIILIITLLPLIAFAQKTTVNSVGNEQEKNIKAAQQSQVKVDKAADETQILKNEYRQVLQSIENNKIYNEQLREVIQSQKEEMKQIEADIAKIQETTQKISPLMTKMKDSLKEFVNYDLPFLKEERSKRLKSLDKLYVKSGVTLSEKYRKVLEAYLIENDYGQTLEAYKDTVEVDGKKLIADFLKVGRLGLYYLTKDGSYGGVWNPEKQDWEVLTSSQRNYVQKALKVALKQSTPSLLTLPVYKTTNEVAKLSLPVSSIEAEESSASDTSKDTDIKAKEAKTETETKEEVQ